jgi:hypothetical protein
MSSTDNGLSFRQKNNGLTSLLPVRPFGLVGGFNDQVQKVKRDDA